MILSSFTGASTKCFKALREQLIAFSFLFSGMNTCLRERERDGERERDERGMSVEDEGKTDG